MGTDIHGVVEQLSSSDNAWSLVYVLRGSDRIGARSYRNFAALAGVRGDGPEPRGLPRDICEATRYLWETVGDHTPSWLSVGDTVRVLNERPRYVGEIGHLVSEEWREEVEYWFGDCDLEPDDRFVFWFDS